MGRSTKLTPEMQETICQAVSLGMSPERAALCAGIDDSTYYRWMERGENEKAGIYRAFRDAIKGAGPKAERTWLAIIERAMRGEKTKKVVKKYDKKTGQLLEETETEEWLAPPQWTAGAWKLERILAERYRQAPMVQNTVNATTIEVDKVRREAQCMSDEQLKARLEELRIRQGGQ